jgi:hypothetical protein
MLLLLLLLMLLLGRRHTVSATRSGELCAAIVLSTKRSLHNRKNPKQLRKQRGDMDDE